MMRKSFAAVLSLLLVVLLAMPVRAYWGSSWGEEDSGSSDPQVGLGTQKEFGDAEEKTTEASFEETAVPETTCEAEETTVPATEAYTEVAAESGAEAPVETEAAEDTAEVTEPAEETVETPSREEESLGDRLFIRKVTHTEKWKLIVPAVGAAVALAALFVTKNNKKENSSDPVSGYTSMSTWDETDN